MNKVAYPCPEIKVLDVNSDWLGIYERPPEMSFISWPPSQVEYLEIYLRELGCKTVLVEQHYIDQSFMHDDAAYYVRSLRSYPNFTQRVHFFSRSFYDEWWRKSVRRAGNGSFSEINRILQESYLGFSVVRPLPVSPVGRTVLPEPDKANSTFKSIRRHRVHLAGFSLHVEGIPFQSQDQGVSACATAALWSALDCVAANEAMTISSPASITESATRYALQEGRPFPNEGLTVRQMCEATLSAGFSPIVVHGKSLDDDRLQIYGYAKSGFAPVLALLPINGGGSGHAVCCVGVKSGKAKPQYNPEYKFRELPSGLEGLYIHDDRLGPYAYARLSPLTDVKSGEVRTCISIEWPDEIPNESWILHAIIVPVPKKLRLTVSRLRRVGLVVAQAIGEGLSDPFTTLDCTFVGSQKYTERIYEFGLSSDGLYRAVCGTALSRYIGLIEIAGGNGPVLDIVVDSTEKNSEAAVLACIRRSGFPSDQMKLFHSVSRLLGVNGIL